MIPQFDVVFYFTIIPNFCTYI